MFQSLRRVLISAVLVSCLIDATVAHAIAPHPLTSADTFGARPDAGAAGICTIDESCITVAGQKAHRALYLLRDGAGISINMQPFRAYNALAFDVGADDSTDSGTVGKVIFYGDGTQLASFNVMPGVSARHEIVDLGLHTIIRVVRQSNDSGSNGAYALVNPELVHQGAPPSPPPSIVLASGMVQAGAQQTIDVSTQANKTVTLLVVYPNGKHLAVGPQKSGPTGHDIYTFTVPSGTHGQAQVVAVITGVGIAQSTFNIS